MKAAGSGGRAAAHCLAMNLAKWKRAAFVLLFVWIFVTYLVISPLRCPGGNTDEAAEFQDRLRGVSAQLDALRIQHAALIAQIKASKFSGKIDIDGSLLLEPGPPSEYETLRRRIYANTKELWYYVSHELGQALKEDVRAERIQTLLVQLEDRKSSLLADEERMSEMDGYFSWRAQEAANVSDLVQRRLRHIQNPPDCRQARKLVCNLNKGCGFGCQVHHIAYCLIFAYATERTLVLNSRGWRYHTKGWDYVFRPLSDTCTSTFDDEKVLQWPDQDTLLEQKMQKALKRRLSFHEFEEEIYRSDEDIMQLSYDAKVVSLPFIDSISQKPKFLPLAVPKDLAHRILKFNGDPASWWVGQMLKYVLQPRAHMQKTINETVAKMNFKNPIVGVHIRRTDKVGTEAAFHHIHEYMTHVKQYWKIQEHKLQQPVEKRVYLASDDANVLEDARKRYPDVEFIGDADISRTAATHRRYTPASLLGLLVDLTLLARTDYLVCTFSSQVGRVAYELMQGNRVDASDSVFSLDDIYYFGGQNAHDRRAVAAHSALAAQDISFKTGDLIGVAGNHWNGYGRGTNKRTNQNGLIPWYKTADHLVLYPFPEYKEVPLYSDTRQT